MSSPREWELYVEEKEREPRRLSKEHPDAWQWDYGYLARKEREELLQELLTKEVDDDQEKLF